MYLHLKQKWCHLYNILLYVEACLLEHNWSWMLALEIYQPPPLFDCLHANEELH